MATFGYTSVGATELGVSRIGGAYQPATGFGIPATSTQGSGVESVNVYIVSSHTGTSQLKGFISNAARTQNIADGVTPSTEINYSSSSRIDQWVGLEYSQYPNVENSIQYYLCVVEIGTPNTLITVALDATPDVGLIGSENVGYGSIDFDNPNASDLLPLSPISFSGIWSIYATYAEAPSVELPTVVTHAITNIKPM